MSPNRVLTIYKTFEEMDADRLNQAASLDPVDGLRQTVELILRAYGTNRDELKARFQKNKITITSSI